MLGRFEITSTITPWIVQHEVQLLINRNYNKIREEYKLFHRLIYSTSNLGAEKEVIQVQLARARWRALSNYSGMTRTTVQLRRKSGLLMTNQIREFWYSCDCYYYYSTPASQPIEKADKVYEVLTGIFVFFVAPVKVTFWSSCLAKKISKSLATS